MNEESRRLAEAAASGWKRWGPYLAERQWGTVREDYSDDGEAWDYFPHDHARSRAYRWGEDGIAGVCDAQQRLCLSLAVWNGRDPFLKERLFGLTGKQGNHGEDVKELYYYLDNTPTHSYMKALYKYPQAEFPYAALVEGGKRGRDAPEFELADTGALDENRYFDIFAEYAKAGPNDLAVRLTAFNRGPEAATLWLIPQLVFRNTWSWGRDNSPPPRLWHDSGSRVEAEHPTLGRYTLLADESGELLFTHNETNARRLFGQDGPRTYCKDAFHDYLVGGDGEAVNPAREGTKAAVAYRFELAPGGRAEVRLRLCESGAVADLDGVDSLVDKRGAEADAFYADLQSGIHGDDERRIHRQALAGMLWSKQYYYFDVEQWLEGDPSGPVPSASRRNGRNAGWVHLNNADIISMPDKWEYPWYAAWDVAFHCLPLSLVDPDFAKEQLVLFTREWYMHPNGQLPAYEWEFGDVNPPVHAWAAWRVYKIDAARQGTPDRAFLERVFHKMLLNFTWWVNRKDAQDNNLFQGGFLGLDNIGVFDRSKPLPTGGHIEQADGTSWMAMFCLNMLRIALELSEANPIYQDLATKFFEHFLYIAGAMRNIGGDGVDLWDEEDEFYHDVLHLEEERFGEKHRAVPLKIRSMVGLIPLFAVETLEPELLDRVPEFKRRLEWFLENRPELAELVSRWHEPGLGERRLLSLLRGHRMKCLLRRMLDESEFLSDHGVRGLSKVHEAEPYVFRLDGSELTVRYVPGESDSGMFGGNSNWRGPVWFPVNFLIIESLQKFHHYYGDDFKVECPTGSGTYITIQQVADELTRRLTTIFLRDDNGRRPVFGDDKRYRVDAHFRDYLLFYEYFHGDNGRGVGASHQTGWTGLIAKLLQPRIVDPAG